MLLDMAAAFPSASMTWKLTVSQDANGVPCLMLELADPNGVTSTILARF